MAEGKTGKRVGFIDEVRGFAIICMVVYHIMFDLKYMYGVDVPIFFEPWFDIIRDIFAGAFIFISGTACRYSHNNMKRGIQCFFIGMIVTFVTAFVTPSSPDMFGILHCLGVCMMLFGIFEGVIDKIPPFLGIFINVVLFAATFNVKSGYIGFGNFSISLPRELYSAKLLFPLGFADRSFSSSDYFPLLGWLFLFLAGAYFGVYVKNNLMPKFFYNTHIKLFALAGRYTLWIYLAHQPLAFVILGFIFGKFTF